jgi:hypothetical protein
LRLRSVVLIYRTAKAGHIASMYKKFGNLCYVIGAIQAFMTHENKDLRMRVRILVYIMPVLMLHFSSWNFLF